MESASVGDAVRSRFSRVHSSAMQVCRNELSYASVSALREVIIDGRDLYADGVNTAAPLEALGEPGGISQTVRNRPRDKISFQDEDLAEQALKNGARPVVVLPHRLRSPRRGTISHAPSACARTARVGCSSNFGFSSRLRVAGLARAASNAGVMSAINKRPPGRKPMMSIDLSRREFLVDSGLAVATATAMASGLAGIDPAWGLATKTIDPETAWALLDMSRVLYPHAILSDAYYGKAVEALDAGAGVDPVFAAMLRDGVAKLGAPYGIPFHKLSPGNRLEAVKAAEGSEFFEAVRGTIVWTLYSNPQVWPLFGYQGSSVEYGGYLERGFDDIAWLPKE
jgi:hypothetical protein